MTYRSLTERQLSRHRRDCEAARVAYVKANPNDQVSLSSWRTAWSKAFLHGANHVEARYKSVGLFDETEKELRARVVALEQENRALREPNFLHESTES